MTSQYLHRVMHPLLLFDSHHMENMQMRFDSPQMSERTVVRELEVLQMWMMIEWMLQVG